MPGDERYVVFAGAGVSMVAPSSLPNWWAFNEVVLGALAERLSAYTRPSLGESAFERLVARRDGTTTFAPDYMADIIAEECGHEYFRVLQALDTDAFNDCHAAVADLAAAGRCAAVVTTNFDRLFERAFDARGEPYEVFFSPGDFERLGRGGRDGHPTPIIKVHGSVESPDSMVDTLSQRLMGRPESLEAALRRLYADHHLLILGFSGADLDYDPGYLGLREAAERNRGFTYLALSEDTVKSPIWELADAWGEQARVVVGRLPEWLNDWSQAKGIARAEPPADSAPVDRVPAVREHAAGWAASLSEMTATNILASLLRAGGSDPEAGYALYSVWRHYRSGRDSEDPAYARFHHHLSRYLLEYGWSMDTLRPPHVATTVLTSGDASDEPGLATGRRDNGFQFAARAYEAKNPGAGAELAVSFALMGQLQRALEVIDGLLSWALEAQHPPLAIDTTIAGGLIWSMASAWTDGLERLEPAASLARSIGQEQRRARVLAHLVRFLAFKERPDQAEAAYHEGRRITERLGMDRTRLQLDSAWGYALYEQRRFAEGVEVLLPVCLELEGSGRLADLTRAGLDLFDAAYGLWEQDPLQRAFGILQEHEIGYRPHVELAWAEFHLKNDELDQAGESARLALEAAEETANRGALQQAQQLLETIQARA